MGSVNEDILKSSGVVIFKPYDPRNVLGIADDVILLCRKRASAFIGGKEGVDAACCACCRDRPKFKSTCFHRSTKRLADQYNKPILSHSFLLNRVRSLYISPSLLTFLGVSDRFGVVCSISRHFALNKSDDFRIVSF